MFGLIMYLLPQGKQLPSLFAFCCTVQESSLACPEMLLGLLLERMNVVGKEREHFQINYWGKMNIFH